MKKHTTKFLVNFTLFLLLFNTSFSSKSYASTWYKNEIKRGEQVEELFVKELDGDFGSLMMIVENYDEILKQAESGNSQFEARQTSFLKKGEEATIIFDLFGCQAGKNGLCKVMADIVATDPNDKIYFEQSDITLMSNGPVPKGRLYLSNVSFKILAEEKDIVGKYLIVVRVKDLIGKKEVILKNYFSIYE